MRSYPSIPRSSGQDFQEFEAHVWDKLDGSNLRFEWSRKQGWFKFGTRNRLFDATDDVFGKAIPLFLNGLGAALDPIVKANRWDKVVAFAEFFGEGSIAGWHDPNTPKTLSLLDVAVNNKGLMGTKTFLDTFYDKVETPKYLGKVNWTRGFVARVRENAFEGVTFEGVVGKAGDGHHQIRSKAKTQIWVDAILNRYGTLEGGKIVNS